MGWDGARAGAGAGWVSQLIVFQVVYNCGLGWAGLGSTGAHLPVVEQLSHVGSWGEGDTQTMSYSS